MSKHKVKLHRWTEGGTLESFEYEFESLQKAYHFVESKKSHHAKIYDEDNQIIYEQGQDPTVTTYA